ncbi:MAG: N(4)-(beta-N-acetylglucosaminyl)-L-asparaginase, partial [Planctomycetota bacterium]|nr:N(4)-(beta-N-acetylglucosaminyl)-L-asparaginase [Planctomycetota bacterium]
STVSSSETPRMSDAETNAAAAGYPKFISTWKFGKAVNEAALQTVEQGGSMLDGIEKGIWVAEADAQNASVGLGGIPAANGVVQLDACIMNGPDHNAGSVAGIEDILHPISVARKVMEETIHVMLVGEGAKEFALQNGFTRTSLLTDGQKENYKRFLEKQKAEKQQPPEIDENCHDTIALLGLDADGNLFGGCSTSGWGFKIPGRVGDSPIIGSGLYVDNEVGAAGATGIGENVMRYCASFMIVEEMRHGANPQQAIETVIARIVKKDPRKAEELAINFVAMNRKADTGAAGTSRGFQYAVTQPGRSEVQDARAISHAEILEGGNRGNR